MNKSAKKVAPKDATFIRKTYCSFISIPKETEKEITFLSRTMTHLWNLALEQCTDWLRMGQEDPNKRTISAISFNYWISQIKRFASFKLESGESVEMSSISVDLMRQVLKKFVGSWQSFFNLRKNRDTKALPPGEQKESRFLTLSWSTFALKESEGRKFIVVPGFSGQRIWIPLDRYLVEKISDCDIKYVTLNKVRGRFKLNIVVAVPRIELVKYPQTALAIDLGAGDIAIVDSRGFEYLIPARRPDKYWRKKIKSVEGRVARTKEGSRAYKRRMGARRKMHNKSSEQHRSFQRKLANALVTHGIELIIIGKSKNRLGLAKSEKGTADQHWGAQNTGFLFQLLLFIKEKAQERGIKIIELKDPKRIGDIKNKEAKLVAAHSLLREGVVGTGVKLAKHFERRKFHFAQ